MPKRRMTPVRQETRFQRVLSQLGEFFPDYFVIVRTQDGLRWHASEMQWAIGANKQYEWRREAEAKSGAHDVTAPKPEDTDDES